MTTEAAIIEALRTLSDASDVHEPFDLAVDHAMRHGLSVDLAAAVRAARAALTGRRGGGVHAAKRRASLLLVLAGDRQPGAGMGPCWSAGLRRALDGLPTGERRGWERLLLAITLRDEVVISDGWRGDVGVLIEEVGSERILHFLGSCWPGVPRGRAITLRAAGSQVLKHFVWLLEVLAETHPDTRGRADELVGRLASRSLLPTAPSEKVAFAVATYLHGRPAHVAARPMAELARWSEATGKHEGLAKRVADLSQRYVVHGAGRAQTDVAEVADEDQLTLPYR